MVCRHETGLPTALQPFLDPGARELFLGLACLGAASHFALGHVAGEATDVILQDLILVFQLIVV